MHKFKQMTLEITQSEVVYKVFENGNLIATAKITVNDIDKNRSMLAYGKQIAEAIELYAPRNVVINMGPAIKEKSTEYANAVMVIAESFITYDVEIVRTPENVVA